MDNTENKKYELTDDYIMHHNVKLYRIRALKDFADVKKGDIGGYVQSKYNLSHNGSCWIYNDAKVLEDAYVKGNAHIHNSVIMHNKALLCENAEVRGHARLSDNCYVRGNVKIKDYAVIEGECLVDGHTLVSGHAHIGGKASISSMFGQIAGNARIEGQTVLRYDFYIGSNAIIDMPTNGITFAHISLGRNAFISQKDDILFVGNGRGGVTFYRTVNGGISVFNDFPMLPLDDYVCEGIPLNKFLDKVKRLPDDTEIQEYTCMANLAMLHINKKVGSSTEK